MKKKILFIRKNRTFGGCENRLLDWVKRIDYSKTDVTIATTHDGFSPRIDTSRFPVKIIPIDLGFEFTMVNVYRWARFLLKNRADRIIFMYGTFYEIPLFLTIIASIVSRNNVFITVHALPPLPPERSRRVHMRIFPGLGIWWLRSVYPYQVRGRFPRKIFAVSDSVKRRLLKWSYPGEKIHMLGHGIDTWVFAPSPERRKRMREGYGIKRGTRVIVGVSRLSPEKGYDRLIEAFNILSDEYDDVVLFIVGDGPIKGDLENSVKDKGKVRFLGHVERKEIAPILNASDIYILPSDSEGFGIALLEALSSGLICLATKGSGPDDIISDGENGFLISTSPRDIYLALKKILEMGSEEREAISAKARELVKSRFQVEDVVRNSFLDLEIPYREFHPSEPLHGEV